MVKGGSSRHKIAFPYVLSTKGEMMLLNEVFELYNLISRGTEHFSSRKQVRLLRKKTFNHLLLGIGFNKIAFDTRRIDQETEYIPRRGLQNYHRSEKFISDAIAQKIQAYTKLAAVLDQLKLEYGREHEWQDSYTRILSSTVNSGLRTIQSDGDFSDCQPSVGSFDYLDELMYVRYRLNAADIVSMSDENLRKTILSKDEQLVSQGVSYVRPNLPQEITPADVSKYSYDAMMEKMMTTLIQVMSNYKPAAPDDNLTNKLFDVKATKDSPEIERTVVIKISDKLVDKIEKTGITELSSKIATEQVAENESEVFEDA
jgi:hypothetical protein